MTAVTALWNAFALNYDDDDSEVGKTVVSDVEVDAGGG